MNFQTTVLNIHDEETRWKQNKVEYRHALHISKKEY